MYKNKNRKIIEILVLFIYICIMKIIAKHKDYYDYLQGINGIDELLVLDRTNCYYNTNIFTENDYICLIVCGIKFEGIYKSGKFRYGKDIENYLSDKDEIYDNNYRIYTKKYRYSYIDIQKKEEIYDNDLEYPIYVSFRQEKYSKNLTELKKFPILKQYDFHNVYSAEEIWIHISNWLSRSKNIPNNQTNKEKIVSAGFDLKTSFRKM